MTETGALAGLITKTFERKGELDPKSLPREVTEGLEEFRRAINAGEIRAASPPDEPGGNWTVNPWVKQGILLYFWSKSNKLVPGVAGTMSFDKIPLLQAGWTAEDFAKAGYRSVQGSLRRDLTFVDKTAVLMPSYVNSGAYVGEGTMVDTWATIGSCAQIGRNCHISGGVGIGGVLEPPEGRPNIIEDNVFVGARSEVVGGFIVREGSVLAMGTFLGPSVKIVERETGKVSHGEIPANSVVVPGSVLDKHGKCHLYAAIILGQAEERHRENLKGEDLLRIFD